MSGGIPEFSSFPPTFSSFPDLGDEPGPPIKKKELKKSTTKHIRDDEKHKDRHSKHSDKERHSHSKDDKKKKKKHRDRDADSKLTVAEDFIEEALRDQKHSPSEPVSVKGLYIEDRRGDESNIRYGGSYDTAKFKRLGCEYTYVRSTARC